MAERHIGYGYTNASGVATLEYAPDGTSLSHSYTGVGAGKVDVVAKSGTLQSETYAVLDCMFLDDGTSDKSSSWTLNSASYSQSSGSVTLSNTTGSNKWISAKVNGSSSGYIDSNSDYCVEVDIMNIDATNISIYLDNSNVDVISSVSTTDFTHIKIYTNRAENKLYYEIGGATGSKTLSTSSGNVALRIGISESYKFKNYELYPI